MATSSMERTGTPQQVTNVGSVLINNGLTQVGLMAGIVTMVAQPFAQDRIRIALGLADWVPVAIAITVSILLSIYYVRVVQKIPMGQCFIVAPLAAGIIFSSALGTNNFFAGEQQTIRQNLIVDNTQVQQMEVLKEQIKARDLLLEQSFEALGIPSPISSSSDADTNTRRQDPDDTANLLGNLLGTFISEAHGQEGSGASVRVLDRAKLQRLQEARDAFRRENQRLQAEEQKLRASDTRTQSKRIKLWKPWFKKD